MYLFIYFIYISSPSEVLRYRDGVLYRSARLYSAAFDRVSHSGLLFKLKSIGVGGSVLSICTESESISMTSGVPQGSVVGPRLFIEYTSEMFELVEN